MKAIDTQLLNLTIAKNVLNVILTTVKALDLGRLPFVYVLRKSQGCKNEEP